MASVSASAPMRWGIFPLALCACSTSTSFGRKFNSAHVSDIRPCETSEKNLLAWFGEPIGQGVVNGLPTLQWSYMATTVNVGSSGSAESQSLVVVLNRDGKVVQFQFNPVCPATMAKDICAGPPDASTE
jgi:hypothetical protein